MSGTSVDGIDVALVDIQGKAPKALIQPLAFKTFPYPSQIRRELLSLSRQTALSLERLVRLDFALGELFAQAALRLLKEARVSPKKVELIGSHGQTICHSPNRRRGLLGGGGTLQIGEPSVIAERTGIPTIADFRRRDIAAGGKGAPLASFLHWALCADAKKDTIVLNVGGIANVTFIPKGAPLSRVVAFDTGPGNMVIDSLVRHFSRGRFRFDPQGTWAKRGRVHEPLLRSLMSHRYFYRRPPKTAGREEFGWDRVKGFLEDPRWRALSRYDWVATTTAWTVYSVENQIRSYIPKGFEADRMIVGGGGSRNPTLMKGLQKRFPKIKVASFESIGWDSDAIEAIAFALLAYEAYHGRSNHLPQGTGAARSCILGKFIPGLGRL